MNLLFGLIAGRQVPRNVVLASRPNVSDASAYYTERDYQTLDVVWSKNWSPQLYTPIQFYRNASLFRGIFFCRPDGAASLGGHFTQGCAVA